MNTQEQAAWPGHEAGTDPDVGAAAGGAAGKKRSPAVTPVGESSGSAAEGPTARHPEPSQLRDQSESSSSLRDLTSQDPRVRRYTPEPPAWATRVVRSEAQFEELGAAWSALLEECEDANVFLSHEWLYSWWCAYRPRAELALLLVEDRGRLRGIAPLMIESGRQAGVRVSVLRFIGDGSGETDHISFLAARSDRAEVVRALLEGIDTLAWDVAQFNQMPAESGITRAVLDWIDRKGLRSAVEIKPCPVRRLPATFDELLSTLPSRLRTSIRSSRKKLQQKHRVEFGMHSREEELAPALQALFANHASRWQGKGQAGAFADERRRDFYGRLTPRLLQRGWLRFFYLKLDGRPVAHQYCFAVDGTVMLLQEGFDFAHAQDNLGNVLRAQVFEHLIQGGALAYDFLAGTSRHKQNWTDGTVNDLRIHCARPSLRGWLFFSVPQAVERAKDALRPWRDRLLNRPGTAASAARGPERG